MDKTEMLFIRACKIRPCRARLRSLIRRFYCTEYNDALVANILTRICMQYDLVSLEDLVSGLNPFEKWKYVEESEVDEKNLPWFERGQHAGPEDYWDHVVGFLSTKIALAPINKLPESFVWPAWSRKRFAA